MRRCYLEFKAFLADWQLPEYIWECCLPNLMSQNGNCSMQWLHRQCCVKSSHKIFILMQYNTIWLFMSGFGQGENWSHILETSLQDPPPPLWLGIYKCIPLVLQTIMFSGSNSKDGDGYGDTVLTSVCLSCDCSCGYVATADAECSFVKCNVDFMGDEKNK